MMIVVAVLNAVRNSFSFFLLLIVCMGYGVVKPSLGKLMIYARWLAAVHFVFGLIYAVASLMVTPDNAGPIVLFVILPLAGTLTAFYVWTLSSLQYTIKELNERKQYIKMNMYRKLWYCILFSILVIFGFFFFNSVTFAGVADPDFVPKHWKSRWFILDGWLNIVYFADVAFICYMWIPTANNRRFAMSDEVRFGYMSLADTQKLTSQPRLLKRTKAAPMGRNLKSPTLASVMKRRRLSAPAQRASDTTPAPSHRRPQRSPRRREKRRARAGRAWMGRLSLPSVMMGRGGVMRMVMRRIRRSWWVRVTRMIRLGEALESDIY